ncbi:helix-turn-helix domain-containing protein [Streptosporangium sp. NBC_01639]|uniref:helix-turn-helix domain-containing protein n=1 Tax=Streptosporangium sp. NBC_01639 TaxID=2975948 RepID=UPI00386E7DB1|nr:helix-turn-helix domain-containing protein [Streptosporangium sp. NBC_01639]
MNDGSSIGNQLKRIREDQDLTQEELAERAGLSRDIIAKLEQGRRKSARLTTLIKLANALDVDLSKLTDKRDRMGADRDGGSVLALRDALLSPSFLPNLDDGHDGEPTPLGDIKAAVDDACRRYWAGEFPALVAQLPGLIAEARLAHSALGPAAVYPLAMAYDLAASIMVHLGRDDLAAIGAERAITTAHGGGDELLWATLHGTYAWVMLHQARLQDAERLAATMAQRIEPSFSAPATHVAVWGNLLMTALAPAAAAGRDVAEYISLATAGAERLGERVPFYNSSFGPATVAMQATHAYTVRREPDKALKASQRIHPGEVTGISYGRHLLDVAQAHFDARRHATAVQRLQEAQALSPVWFRHQGVARSLVREIREEEMRLSPAVRLLVRSLDIES